MRAPVSTAGSGARLPARPVAISAGSCQECTRTGPGRVVGHHDFATRFLDTSWAGGGHARCRCSKSAARMSELVCTPDVGIQFLPPGRWGSRKASTEGFGQVDAEVCAQARQWFQRITNAKLAI